MLRHTLLLVARSFMRFKGTFFINLVGLSTGLACTMLIYLWVSDEFDVDKFLDSDGRLVQVLQNTKGSAGIATIEATPHILAKSLADELPEVEFSTSVIPPSFNASKGIVSFEGRRFKTDGQYATKDFFQVFSYQLLRGDKDRILSGRQDVVISSSLALRIFNSIDRAVGKSIEWSAQDISATGYIAGVFESPPANATAQFDIVLNYQLFQEKNPSEGWSNNSPRTYVLMKDGSSFESLNEKVRGFIQAKDPGAGSTLFIQRYAERYLHGQYENGTPSGGRIGYVRLFSTIAVFLLFIACINFMNLFTARASRRIKEAGIKKTIGAKTSTLIFQYLSESFFMALLSMGVAVLVVDLMVGPFSTLTSKALVFTLDNKTMLVIAGVTLFTALLAGSYPALFLSGFRAAEVLKGKVEASALHVWARTGCVVFQFVISVVLIVSAWVVYKQVEFLQGRNLGYDRDQVIYFNVENMSEAFLAEIRNLPGVVNAGGGNLEAGKALGGTSGINWEGKPADDNIFFNTFWLSYDLMETLGMEMVAGRPFSREFGSTDQVIFNERAIEGMGLKDPIGKMVDIEGEKKQITGVVRNFHYESLYEPLKPCVLLLAPVEYAPRVSVKIQAGQEQAVIDRLRDLFARHSPGVVFEFRFMDEDYARLYASEMKVSVLSRYFAGIAVLVSCLGLLGLAAFTIERRTKEIGIRKVLGATPLSIFRLLTIDFSKMVLSGVAVGLVISSMIADRWLERFAYRIELEVAYFIIAGLLACVIALLTVAVHAVKGAVVNPVDCLRSE